jgi:flagellar hook-associated protein 1
MVQYQHAYEAAARFMTTVDSVLDTLINHTGM